MGNDGNIGTRSASHNFMYHGMRQPQVVLLPGAINPAAASYGQLLEAVEGNASPGLKDLELYNKDVPPPDYTLETEIASLKQMVDMAELKSFHLVGYSVGGEIALAFAARYPRRLKSLALIEPTWIGKANQSWGSDGRAYGEQLEQIMKLSPEERLQAFMALQLRPGVEPPLLPSSPTPAWLARRPKGIKALYQALQENDLEFYQLRQFQSPVYLAIGSLSNEIEERMAARLTHVFPDIRVEIYAGLHHFNPPHLGATERFARALFELWSQGEMYAPPEK